MQASPDTRVAAAPTDATDAEVAPQPAAQPKFVQVTTELNSCHRRLLAPRILWFNESRERAELLKGCLTPQKSSYPSLRLVDYFVVQYARVVQIMVPGEGGVGVDLWTCYRRMLSAIGKRVFDIFRRKHQLKLMITGEQVDATVGQITFLQWYLRCNLHQYLAENMETVKQHMKDSETALREKKLNLAAHKKTRTASKPELVKPLAVVHRGSFQMDFT
ncbi:hypothetical protein JKP88DRAFT_243981 [Tribonema minus]|uniref:Uncharacterized protein n=1 Tax=Tribonema minus TaxID=303371 RepID=A0A836CL91_9STRA|nr:hypothetical protein JKP88DRAFT_243981 [Tribonema minus]